MSKIKAEKMGELEKLGFSYNDNYGIWSKCLGFMEASKKDIDVYYKKYSKTYGLYYIAEVTLEIDNSDRDISVNICVYSHEDPLIDFYSKDIKYYIQELIKADMVEVCDDL